MSFSRNTFFSPRQSFPDRFQTTYSAAFNDENDTRSSPYQETQPLTYRSLGYDTARLPAAGYNRRNWIQPLLDFPLLTYGSRPRYNLQPQHQAITYRDGTCPTCKESPQIQLACGHQFCSNHSNQLKVSDHPVRRRRQYYCNQCGEWNTRDDYFTGYQPLPSYRSGEPPSDRILGRLARALRRDSPASLAILLDFPDAQNEASRAEHAHKDSGLQRMHVLYAWKVANPYRSTEDLLNLISRRNGYYYRDLAGVVSRKVPQCQYNISSDVLDSVAQFDTDLIAASRHIGSQYHFLMLELGLSWVEIESYRQSYYGDSSNLAYQLLLLWRVKNYRGSTTRELLDTARHLGMDTSGFEWDLRNRYSRYRKD